VIPLSEFDSGYGISLAIASGPRYARPRTRAATRIRDKLENVIFEEMKKQRLEHQVEYAALEPDYPALRKESEEHN